MARKKKDGKQMLIATIIMGLLAFALFVLAYKQGGNEHTEGLKLALSMTAQMLPLLIFALITAGMIQVLLPHALIAKWIGTESGLKGIIIGTIAGGFSPGGPYVSLPLAAGLFRAGAGAGTMVAYLTAWSLWGISRLPMEVGILGWKFTIIRFACTFFFPPVAGLIAQVLFSNIKYNM